jgi:hypothetical protein
MYDARPMRVFISWSGTRSKFVAEFLKEWLADVIQNVKPWMSSKDIEAGDRWGMKIAEALEGSNFGIICLTPENQKEPWLMYEAGAITKLVKEGRAIPYLIGMNEPEEMIQTPITPFQGKVATKKADSLAVVKSMNLAMEQGALSEQQLLRAFETQWPKLLEKLGQLPAAPQNAPQPPATEEMVKEILGLVRGLGGKIADADRSGQVALGALQRLSTQGKIAVNSFDLMMAVNAASKPSGPPPAADLHPVIPGDGETAEDDEEDVDAESAGESDTKPSEAK